MSDKAKSKEMTIFAKDLAKVNVKNLILDNPVTHKNKEGHEWVTSVGHYRDIKTGDRYDDFLFELNPQQVWGISGQWDPKIKEDDRTLENIKGLQICYPLCSLETLKEPTPLEASLKKFLKEVLWQKCWDSMVEFNDKDLIDGPAGSSCTSALKKNNPEYAMKPIYAFPLLESKTAGQKKPDTTKPERSYIELVTVGEGEKLKCLTPIFGPGDKKVSWLKYLSTKSNPIVGTGHFICRWKGTYWGPHGPTSTHGGSVKLEIVEMNFTPKAAATLSYKRMLPANDAVEEKDDSHEGSEGDSSFKHPSGSGIVTSDFAKPEDENVNNLMSNTSQSKNNTNDKTESSSESDQLEPDEEGDDDSEEERRKAEEEVAKRKKEKLEAARAEKKKMIAAKKAGKK